MMTGDAKAGGCGSCGDGISAPFTFSMAFQPIVDVETGRVYAYEALARGPAGEPAATVLAQVTPENRYAFDQACRVNALTLAAKLGVPEHGAHLSINFMPGAVYSPAACIKLTLRTAKKVGFPADRLIFEFVETEEVRDRDHVRAIIDEYRQLGFKVALDDFGAGYSGVDLLASFATDLVKLDMGLIRDVHVRPRARAIVAAMNGLAATLGFELVAEGVETVEEYACLRACGIRLMQGYLLARPAFEALPDVVLPRRAAA
jgi:EAL domain-containing protein (putative c-di-GMP-specific phosphodiesterase class I)